MPMPTPRALPPRWHRVALVLIAPTVSRLQVGHVIRAASRHGHHVVDGEREGMRGRDALGDRVPTDAAHHPIARNDHGAQPTHAIPASPSPQLTGAAAGPRAIRGLTALRAAVLHMRAAAIEVDAAVMADARARPDCAVHDSCQCRALGRVVVAASVATEASTRVLLGREHRSASLAGTRRVPLGSCGRLQRSSLSRLSHEFGVAPPCALRIPRDLLRRPALVLGLPAIVVGGTLALGRAVVARGPLVLGERGATPTARRAAHGHLGTSRFGAMTPPFGIRITSGPVVPGSHGRAVPGAGCAGRSVARCTRRTAHASVRAGRPPRTAA